VAGGLLRNGQLLDLARAGLSEVSRTVNGQGQTVRQVRDTAGNLLEVVTDTANRVVTSRRLGSQRQ
jgi:YD repeat-containing protein